MIETMVFAQVLRKGHRTGKYVTKLPSGTTTFDEKSPRNSKNINKKENQSKKLKNIYLIL